MTMKRLLITLVIILSALLKADASQYYYFNHYTTAEGLPNNSIKCITQDRFGFIWVGTKAGICRFDGYNFMTIGSNYPENTMEIMGIDLSEDNDGNMWFSNANGVGYYNLYTGNTISLGALGPSECTDVEAGIDGEVWFASSNLYKYIKRERRYQIYSFAGGYPNSITKDEDNNLWVALANGELYRYDRRRDITVLVEIGYKVKKVYPASGSHIILSTADHKAVVMNTLDMHCQELFNGGESTIESITERFPGEFWIGTSNGLFVEKEFGRSSEVINHHSSDQNSLATDYIITLFKDRSNNIWVGTFYSGLDFWEDRKENYNLYFPNPSKNTLSGRVVRAIDDDDKGQIWVATEDNGLCKFDDTNRSVTHYDFFNGVNIQDLLKVNDEWWIPTFGSGLYRFNMKTEKVVNRYLNGLRLTSAVKLSSGNIYVGGYYGLYRYDKDTDTFDSIKEFQDVYIHCLFEDSKGNFWAGSYGNGLMLLEEKDGSAHLKQTYNSSNGIKSKYITSFYEDSTERLWVTTEGAGVCYADKGYSVTDMHFSQIMEKDGLTANITCAVIEDYNGDIWVSTANGVSIIDGNDFTRINRIDEQNSHFSNQYSYGASYTTNSGLIYLGTTGGMISYKPSGIKERPSEPTVFITDISARGADGVKHISSKDRSTIMSDEVSVKAKDALILSIQYASPEYSYIRKLKYEYSLTKGRKDALTTHTMENEARFTSLAPGNYVFRVGIHNLPESFKTIKVRVIPPWYRCAAAYCAYVLLAIGLFLFILITIGKRRKGTRKHQLELMEQEKERELYNSKINFFTNITHEIRTPLTLIKMPVDKLVNKQDYTPTSKDDILTIQSNTNRLLELTNQLLDLRKLEQKQIQLDFIKEDICAILKSTCYNFTQTAVQQHIKIDTFIPEEAVKVMCAKDIVEKIITNLLSNAIKYGNDQIDVYLTESSDKQNVYIRVNSNGRPIEGTDREKIFEPFYQIESNKSGLMSNGTGLGLPFSRSLAEMHNGKLFLDDEIFLDKDGKQMNSFVLELPVKQKKTININDEDASTINEDHLKAEFDSNKNTILVAEDADDMRLYVSKELSSDYNVLIATNGEQALEIVRNEKVDLVVSDIMMPLKDGCELCNEIKTDVELSHIPIILLTAAVGVETRLQSLKAGADGYIEKPFSIDLLKANISNLFKNRDIAYKQFTTSPLAHFSSVKTSKIDDDYMTKLHDTVMKHLDEQDLGIETLTAILGTSKSTLYRKVKANTGLNINEYIRLCRLKQAAELLSSQKYRVNEVAYLVGFSSPSYFATCFQNQFNQSPSSFVKNLKE